MGFHTGCLGSSVSKDDVRGFAYNEDQNCVGTLCRNGWKSCDFTQAGPDTNNRLFWSKIEPQSVTEDT